MRDKPSRSTMVFCGGGRGAEAAISDCDRFSFTLCEQADKDVRPEVRSMQDAHENVSLSQSVPCLQLFKLNCVVM